MGIVTDPGNLAAEERKSQGLRSRVSSELEDTSMLLYLGEPCGFPCLSGHVLKLGRASLTFCTIKSSPSGKGFRGLVRASLPKQSTESLTSVAQKAKEAKTKADTARARAFLDRENLSKELVDMRIEFAALQKDHGENVALIDRARENGLDLEGMIASAPPPPIDGIVVAVRLDADLVILSVGRDDLVQVGHEFTIYRADRFVAKVRVTRVTEDMAGASILYTDGDIGAIQVGDNATTRIGLGG